MNYWPGNPTLAGGACQGLLFALAAAAAACSATAPSRSAAPPSPTPSPCALFGDTGTAPADTIRFVPQGGPLAAAAMPAYTCTIPASAGGAPAVDTVAVPRGADLRDLLDRGRVAGPARVDVLITRDPDVLAYAAQLGAYSSGPLPWDRTYVLVAARLDSAPAASTAEQRDALARDAVRADARGAVPPFWWTRDTTCAIPARQASGAPRIVGFRADDPSARQLAERIVALATSVPPPAWLPRDLTSGTGEPRTLGLAPTGLDDALLSGQIVAYVGAVARVRPAACTADTRVPAGGTVIPLVDTRAHVLVRRGSGAAFYLRNDGTLRFVSHPAP